MVNYTVSHIDKTNYLRDNPRLMNNARRDIEKGRRMLDENRIKAHDSSKSDKVHT